MEMTIQYIKDSLPKHRWKRYGRRSISRIKHIVVHHFAGNISIEQAAKFHVSKGWPGIGYWAVIDVDAVVNIVHNIDTISYHVGGNNTPTLGISMRGDYSNDLPSKEMLDSLKKLIYCVRVVVGPLPVDVHRDFSNTECAGDALTAWVRLHYPQPVQLSMRDRKSWRERWAGLIGRDRDHLDS